MLNRFCRRIPAAALALPLLAACDGGGSASADAMFATALAFEPIAPPVAAGSAQPALTADGAGRAILSWHEPAGAGSALRMAVFENGAWGEAATIAQGRDFIVNWADFPGVTALGGGRMAVHWLEREGSDTYAYGVRIALSEDGGRTWSAPVRPHADSTETEHGFVSMLPAQDGVDAIWLDGRAYATDAQEMSLRGARIGAAGVADSVLLDARICDCCQTDAARAASADVVVYRDRSAEEIRDIAIVRRVDGRWSEPALVHADGWEIEGCPVNGPAVAAHGDLVAVAWFTGAQDTARVRVAFSEDGGASFGAPVRVDDGRPAGRVDVVLLDAQSALVSWIEEGDSAGALRVRRVTRDGRVASPLTVASIPAARASGFPRMALLDDALLLAWTDVASGRVQVARAPLAR